MHPRLPRISEEQREGVKKLLDWCIERYKISNGVNAKRMWKSYMDFLAELQRAQSYTENDKTRYNTLRQIYLQSKKREK